MLSGSNSPLGHRPGTLVMQLCGYTGLETNIWPNVFSTSSSPRKWQEASQLSEPEELPSPKDFIAGTQRSTGFKLLNTAPAEVLGGRLRRCLCTKSRLLEADPVSLIALQECAEQ